MTLNPGNLILFCTSVGVGLMKPGTRIEIVGIGTLADTSMTACAPGRL